MKIKPGVVLWRMHPRIEHAIDVADDVHRELFGSDATITSARDGEHSEGSLHYEGKAFDLRTRHLQPGASALIFRNDLAERLGDLYDVVLESNHIHVEYDP